MYKVFQTFLGFTGHRGSHNDTAFLDEAIDFEGRASEWILH